MKTFVIQEKFVGYADVTIEAETEDDAVQLMWSDDCGIADSEYKSAEAEVLSVEACNV